MRVRIVLSAVVLLFAMTGEAFSEPKRVMLLHSFGRDFAPWSEYARIIREELGSKSKEPLDIFETSLATARFAEDEEGPFVDYLHALLSSDSSTWSSPSARRRLTSSSETGRGFFPPCRQCTRASNSGKCSLTRLQPTTASLRSRKILRVQSRAC